MYISISQIERSLFNLKDIHPFFGMSYLAFKKFRLPVGRTEHTIFFSIGRRNPQFLLQAIQQLRRVLQSIPHLKTQR